MQQTLKFPDLQCDTDKSSKTHRVAIGHVNSLCNFVRYMVITFTQLVISELFAVLKAASHFFSYSYYKVCYTSTTFLIHRLYSLKLNGEVSTGKNTINMYARSARGFPSVDSSQSITANTRGYQQPNKTSQQPGGGYGSKIQQYLSRVKYNVLHPKVTMNHT